MATLTAATSTTANRLIVSAAAVAVVVIDLPQIECSTRSDHRRLWLRRRQFLIVAIIITVICMTLLTCTPSPSLPYSSPHPLLTTLPILAVARRTDWTIDRSIARSDSIRGELLKHFAIYATLLPPLSAAVWSRHKLPLPTWTSPSATPYTSSSYCSSHSPLAAPSPDWLLAVRLVGGLPNEALWLFLYFCLRSRLLFRIRNSCGPTSCGATASASAPPPFTSSINIYEWKRKSSLWLAVSPVCVPRMTTSHYEWCLMR